MPLKRRKRLLKCSGLRCSLYIRQVRLPDGTDLRAPALLRRYMEGTTRHSHTVTQ